jgi:hypothetical protein
MDVARDLSEVASELASIKGEAMNWLRDPSNALRATIDACMDAKRDNARYELR